ncbi:MAG: L-threonylcarbamoyladenylate synthase [Candidatus Saccharimonadales bacterium]
MIVFDSLNEPQVIRLLQRGELGVVPTDTIYGLVARAADRDAVARLYQAKRREGKPGTILSDSVEQLIELGISPDALHQIGHVWPNPISVVLPEAADLSYLDQGKGDVAVRIPDNHVLARLLRQTGPLLSTSANLPGEKPARNIAEAQKYFGDNVAFYVDSGDLGHRPPSTVVRYQYGQLRVLRPGAVTINSKGEISK